MMKAASWNSDLKRLRFRRASSDRDRRASGDGEWELELNLATRCTSFLFRPRRSKFNTHLVPAWVFCTRIPLLLRHPETRPTARMVFQFMFFRQDESQTKGCTCETLKLRREGVDGIVSFNYHHEHGYMYFGLNTLSFRHMNWCLEICGQLSVRWKTNSLEREDFPLPELNSAVDPKMKS